MSVETVIKLYQVFRTESQPETIAPSRLVGNPVGREFSSGGRGLTRCLEEIEVCCCQSENDEAGSERYDNAAASKYLWYW